MHRGRGVCNFFGAPSSLSRRRGYFAGMQRRGQSARRAFKVKVNYLPLVMLLLSISNTIALYHEAASSA
jgi:hypothetical protein